jgi:hypothetical protein
MSSSVVERVVEELPKNIISFKSKTALNKDVPPSVAPPKKPIKISAETCLEKYRRAYVQLITEANDLAKSHVSGPAINQASITEDSLAFLIASALASGYHVSVARDILTEKQVCFATKKAARIIASNFSWEAEEPKHKSTDNLTSPAPVDAESGMSSLTSNLEIKFIRLKEHSQISEELSDTLRDLNLSAYSGGNELRDDTMNDSFHDRVLRHVLIGTMPGHKVLESNTLVTISSATLASGNLAAKIARGLMLLTQSQSKDIEAMVRFLLESNPTKAGEKISHQLKDDRTMQSFRLGISLSVNHDERVKAMELAISQLPATIGSYVSEICKDHMPLRPDMAVKVLMTEVLVLYTGLTEKRDLYELTRLLCLRWRTVYELVRKDVRLSQEVLATLDGASDAVQDILESEEKELKAV